MPVGMACENGVCVEYNPGYCWYDSQCAAGQYCFYNSCAVETGKCVKIPEACPMVWDPVCSCNGKTYASLCILMSGMADLDYYGECKIPK